MPGDVYSRLFEVAANQYGYITPDDARGLGINPQRLPKMAERGVLDRVANAVYRFPTVPATALDQYMEATLWPRGGGVLSHDTALDLLDLCDINPAKIHLTVRQGLRVTRDVPKLYVLHHRELPAEDVTLHEGIPIVTAVRAILDGIERVVGRHLITQAIDTARRRGLITADQARMLNARRQVPTAA